MRGGLGGKVALSVSLCLLTSVVGWAADAPKAKAAAAKPAPGEAVIVSRVVKEPPAIDGKLDDACWREAERTRPFSVLEHEDPVLLGTMLLAEGKFVANAATAQVCHDDKNLYVAFRAPVPPGMKIKAAVETRGGSVWSDDCIELFLDPLRNGAFYQVMANAKGAFAEFSAAGGGGAIPGWDSKARVRGQSDDAGFTVEMAVPFEAMGNPDHTAGTAWAVNFTREGATGGGLSTWAPVGHSFATPSRFGMLIFDSRKAYALRNLATLQASLTAVGGEDQRKLVADAEGALQALKVQIERDGDRASEWPAIQSAFASADTLIRRIAAKGRAYMFWLKDLDGPISPNEPVDIRQDHLTSLRVPAALNMRARSGFLATNLLNKPMMGRFAVKRPAPTDKKEAGLSLLEVSRLRLCHGLYLELSSGLMIPDVIVPVSYYNLIEVPAQGTVPVWVEVDTHGATPGRYVRDLDFVPSYSGFPPSSLRIEVDIAPVDLDSVRVQGFTYLSDPNSQRWPVAARDMYRHGFNTIHCIPMIINGPNQSMPVFDAEGRLVSYDWSTLEQSAANMLNLAGGDPKSLYVLMYFGWNERWYRDLGTDATVKFGFGTDGWKKAFANWLTALRDFYLKKGFTCEQIAIKTLDEPCGDPADPKSTGSIAIRGARFIKEVDPRLRTMCNPSMDSANFKYLPAYAEVYDIIQPYDGHVRGNTARMDALRKTGRELWSYGIYGKDTPPGVYRDMSWFSAANGYSGVCGYAYYIWNSGDPFNSCDSRPSTPNYIADYSVVHLMTDPDTMLFDPATAVAPLSTRRWEAWYQGSVDFRAIKVCRELIARLKAAGKADAAAPYETRLSGLIGATTGKSGVAMDAAREALIQMAVSMQTDLAK